MNFLLLFFSTPRRLLITLAMVLVLSLIVILLLPSTLPKARSLSAQDGAWQLDTPASVTSDDALSVISQRRLWGSTGALGQPVGALAAANEKPLTPPDWRVAGVISERGSPAVLVTTEGPLQPPPQALRVGDSLPGGAKILAIRSDRIILSLNGQRLSLSTYPQ